MDHAREPERRRRRPPVSCILCRKRKIKCNRGTPCSNCLRSRNVSCVYEEVSPPRPARRIRQSSNSRPGSTINIGQFSRSGDQHNDMQVDQSSTIDTVTTAHTSPSTAPTANTSVETCQSSPEEIQSMIYRIKQLEEQLSKASHQFPGNITPSPNYNISTTTSHFAGTFSVHSETLGGGQQPTISRAIMHKTRVFGQSHWMNGVAQFAEILDLIEPYLQNEGTNAMTTLSKCKWLGKMIKAQRTPTWPCPPTNELPPKEVADILVANYLRTFETIYRVLHIPTFKRDYESTIEASDPDISFVILLKLVMAIGSAMYDEGFSMHATAIRWIHEAQTWTSEPEFKARLGIQFLQIHILLLLARQIVGVEGGLVWITTGEVIRLAIYMGLNRDPEFLPEMSRYTAEMRRRLWNTLLELELQTSMESGGPPLCSLESFNTMPPGNFDDEAISVESPVPAPDDIFTDVSMSLALRKMFPLRLHIAKVLNGLTAHVGYEETVRLDGELRASYRYICQQLQRCKTREGARGPSDFQNRILDFFIRRYLTALHMPFFGASMKEVHYAYSRKVVTEASLKIWCTIFPSSPILTSKSPPNSPSSPEPDDLARLASCGTGMFRTTSVQATFLIAAELKTQLQEESSLGPRALRRDLFTVLQDAKIWCLRCIEAGETNVKGYLFLCLVCAQIDGLMRGFSREEFPDMLLKEAEEAEARCLKLLEANFDASSVSLDRASEMSMEPLSEMTSDWSLMMPGTHFYLGDPGSMDWMTMDSLAASVSYQGMI